MSAIGGFPQKKNLFLCTLIKVQRYHNLMSLHFFNYYNCPNVFTIRSLSPALTSGVFNSFNSFNCWIDT